MPGADGFSMRRLCVRVAQQDRAQDSLLVELGVAQGNGAAEPLKVGESLRSVWGRVPIPSQARSRGREGVETGWVAPKGLG